MPLFGAVDEPALWTGAGVVVGGLATLLGVILRGGRAGSAQAVGQWKAYGEKMAENYQSEVIRRTAIEAELGARLLTQAEELGRLRAENALLKERLK
jgi:hypothetical protein